LSLSSSSSAAAAAAAGAVAATTPGFAPQTDLCEWVGGVYAFDLTRSASAVWCRTPIYARRLFFFFFPAAKMEYGPSPAVTAWRASWKEQMQWALQWAVACAECGFRALPIEDLVTRDVISGHRYRNGTPVQTSDFKDVTLKLAVLSSLCSGAPGMFYDPTSAIFGTRVCRVPTYGTRDAAAAVAAAAAVVAFVSKDGTQSMVVVFRCIPIGYVRGLKPGCSTPRFWMNTQALAVVRDHLECMLPNKLLDAVDIQQPLGDCVSARDVLERDHICALAHSNRVLGWQDSHESVPWAQGIMDVGACAVCSFGTRVAYSAVQWRLRSHTDTRCDACMYN
jgi:hypothetical protein